MQSIDPNLLIRGIILFSLRLEEVATEEVPTEAHQENNIKWVWGYVITLTTLIFVGSLQQTNIQKWT